MLPRLLILGLIGSLHLVSLAQPNPHGRLKVSDNQRFLVHEDGTPFFYQGDTAWELFHRCNREEADRYLQKRAEQGYNVVQAVALAELDGLQTPNPYGEVPLQDLNPASPNPAYFEHVDYVIDRAAELGIYIALLPTWGDKLFKAGWGIGPEVLTVENARAYGKWIGERYRDRDNIIWVIGGDRNPREGTEDVAVWRAMAGGVVDGVGGQDKALMTFHPQPRDRGGSSVWFHQDKWLDFNMHQTGHCANRGTFRLIEADYHLQPTKPTLDGEPLYEDHPNCFNAKDLGHSVPEDFRRIWYWNVFAGAFGQTYGCHDVWQMYKPGRDPINSPLRPWEKALDLPGARQLQHLKHLMLSRPFLSRIPAQDMVRTAQADDNSYTIATRDAAGQYAMVYSPQGKPFEVDMRSLKGSRLKRWWYDPRTGTAMEGPIEYKSDYDTFTPPSSGPGHDWVLVLDNAAAGFGRPGR